MGDDREHRVMQIGQLLTATFALTSYQPFSKPLIVSLR